jgi:tetratricopeptide (TPR) repeat protein
LSISVFLAYSNSLNGIWAFDDVLTNQPLGIDGLIEKFGARKVSYLTFAINQMIDPYSPVNFRLFNILIHILNSLLVYVIALITLRLPDYRERFEHYSFSVALISSMIFALHPLNINAVAYIIQRMASLATFFVLLALVTYIFAAKSKGAFNKIILYFMTFAFILLGILSKENAVMGIPLIMLYDYVFLSRFDFKTFKPRAAGVVVVGSCILLVASIYINVYNTAINIAKDFLAINKPLVWKFWMAIDVYWSPLEHILTEFRVVSRYLFLFVLPLPKFLVFDWWGYPISKGLFNPVTTFFSMGFIVGALVFSILKRKKYPFLSFGILWYFIAISLESFIAVGSDLYFEHRNYLPLAGLSFGLVAQAVSSFGEKIRGKYTLLIIFITLSAILGFLTFQRNYIWKDPVTFWKDPVQKTSGNIRATLALANSYFSMSDFKNAKSYYIDSVQLARERKVTRYMAESLYRLGFTDLLLLQGVESKKIMDVMEKLSPHTYYLKILQGLHSYINQDYEGAIRSYLQVLEVHSKEINRSERVTVLTLMGDAYRDMGLADEALNSYKNALSLHHSFPAAYHGMAKIQLMKGDLDSASEHLRRVLSIDPYNIGALSDMANLILIRGEGAEKALPFAKRAVSLNPPFYRPYLIMGTVLIASGVEKDAEGYYIKAKELRSPDYLINFNKAWAYSLRGDREKQKYYLIELLKLRETPENISDTARKILSRLNKQ